MIAGLAALAALAGPAQAATDDPVARPAPTTPVEAVELAVIDPEAQRLEIFARGLFQGLMKTRHVPGAVLVIVKQGRVLLSQGYGYADVDGRRGIDPNRTQFRLASISKLFTALAAMQEVEAGRLALDADVNASLAGFGIGDGFGRPVTLADLLTHTAGFDDRFRGCCRWLGEGPREPLGAYLARNMPPRVMPPGEVISYSNHGYALIGHLAERSAGIDFATLTRERLFAPLGMTASHWGLDATPPGALALGYRLSADGEFVPRRPDIDHMGPAGELVTTGADMGRFMLAMLNGGELEGRRVIAAATLERMQATQFRNAPGLDGWGYGFYERHVNGWRTVGHDGSWAGYASLLVLVPEARTGIFIAVNIDHDAVFFRHALQGLMEALLPVKGVLRPASDARAEGPAAEDIAGHYIPNRRMRGDLMKLGVLIMGLELRAGDDGGLTGGIGPDAVRFRPVGPGLWRDEAAQLSLAAITDADGAVTRIAVDQFAFDRASLAMTPAFTATLLGAVLAIALGTVWHWGLAGPVSALRGLEARPAMPLAYRLVAVACCGLAAIYVLAVVYALLTADPFEVIVEPPPLLATAVWLAPALAVLALPLAGLGVAASLRGAGRRRARLLALLPLPAIAATLWFAWYWNAHPWGL